MSKEEMTDEKGQLAMEWLFANMQDLAQKHPNCWVAVTKDGLAGYGKELKEAIAMAKTNHVEDPLVSRVVDPMDTTRKFYGSFRAQMAVA